LAAAVVTKIKNFSGSAAALLSRSAGDEQLVKSGPSRSPGGAASASIGQTCLSHSRLLVLAVRAMALSLCVFMFVFAVHAAGPQRVEGRILVKPKAGVSDSAWKALLAAHGADELSAIHQIDVHI